MCQRERDGFGGAPHSPLRLYSKRRDTDRPSRLSGPSGVCLTRSCGSATRVPHGGALLYTLLLPMPFGLRTKCPACAGGLVPLWAGGGRLDHTPSCLVWCR